MKNITGQQKDRLAQYELEVWQKTDAELAKILPQPTLSDHKYTRGVLGMVCGSDEFPGAALMSCRAAINSGVGMVRFVGDDRLNFMVQTHCPEAVTAAQDPEELHVQAWVGGPGATSDARQQALAHTVLAPEAAVLDAAALDLAARIVALETPLGSHKILTPHAGELAGFLEWIHGLNPDKWARIAPQGSSPGRAEIESHPLLWVRCAAQLSGATVLLKGSTTLIASASGQILSVKGGSSWLATAGSGDTLAGILGALLAQYEAARQGRNQEPAVPQDQDYALLAAAGVRIHHLAAESLHEKGQAGPLPPTLVASKIPQAMAQFLTAAG